MATNQRSTSSVRRAPRRGLPSMTERQLDAYLLARDTLRRLRDAGLLEGSATARPPDRRS